MQQRSLPSSHGSSRSRESRRHHRQPPEPVDLPVAGTWKRLHEEDPLGDLVGADRSTLVLWTQSRECGIYIDLRLPKGAPGRSRDEAQAAGVRPRPGALAAIGLEAAAKATFASNPKYFDLLMEQKSFAGVLHYRLGDKTDGTAIKEDERLRKIAEATHEAATPVRGSVISLCTCLWNRNMDYQPPTGGLDVGVCASQKRNADGSILMRETGGDASYAEGWLCLPRTFKGPFLAMELVAENGIDGARHGYWLRTGNKFAYAIGRPVSPEYAVALHCLPEAASIHSKVGVSLQDAVQDLAHDRHEMLDLLASYVCVVGDIRNDERDWTIAASTNPELVGCLLVGERHNTDALCCSRMQSAQSGGAQTGCEGSNNGDPTLVEQVIGREGNLTVKRLWKVMEQTDCSVPFVDI